MLARLKLSEFLLITPLSLIVNYYLEKWTGLKIKIYRSFVALSTAINCVLFLFFGIVGNVRTRLAPFL